MANNKTKVVSPTKFQDALLKTVEKYSEDIDKEIPNIVNAVAKDFRVKLKAEAVRAGKGKWTKYVNKFKIEKAQKTSWKVAEATVYNRRWSRTSWLEHGHVIKGIFEGTHGGHTDPRPHWKPATEWLEKNIIKKFKDVIENIE